MPSPARALINASLVFALMLLSVEVMGQMQTVSVALPESAPVSDRLRLSGTLSAERSARLSPRVDGLVARVHVDAGDTVRAGEPLLELDAALAQRAWQRTRADSVQAQAQSGETARLLAEGRRLMEENHMPRSEVAMREAAHALAEAAEAASRAVELEQAELIERHVLPAPFDGVIVRKLTEAGEWVTRGTPVLELVATDRVRLDVQAPQERYAEIADHAEVTVRPDALPGMELPARIVARVPVAGAATARSFLVRILIDDAEHGLLPGTSATADIPLTAAVRPDVLRIPRDALLRHPDGGFSVFVVEGDPATARRRPVRVGREGDGLIEILQGLSVGEPVVVRGNEMLRDGQAVQIVGN